MTFTRLLVIGEKPSQVKKFKDVLLSNVKSVKHSKYVYSYEGEWTFNQTYSVTMLPLTGHITKIDTPENFGWGKVPPLEIVNNPKALIKREDQNYKKILSRMAKNADQLYIACDPDSEGDNIGFEAFNILIKVNPVLKTQVKRVWNSSLTQMEIIRAFQQTETSPLGWDTKLALSVEGRQLTDAWLGFAGTREITQAARQVHPIRVFSVGRVQLPTLKMIVDRDLEHETFIPQDLWNIITKLKTSKGEEFDARHELNPFKDKSKADQIVKKLKHKNTGFVKHLTQQQAKRKPPVPLNTTAALSLLARLFKLKADKALKILSDLYLAGYISYPRTENAMFKNKFPHTDILQKLAKNNTFNQLINQIKSKHQVRTNGRKKGVEDHDPIHPVSLISSQSVKGKLTKLHLDVWDVITRYYIGLFMDDLILSKLKADIEIQDELFIAKGSTTIQKGWTEAHKWFKSYDKTLPVLQENEILSVINIRNIKTNTKPKPRWSDATILTQMQRLGIGTKSSRPSVLEKLVERGYIARQRQQIISQVSGRVLIQILAPIWPNICSNKFTQHVELKMDEVAKGQRAYQLMIDELRQEYINAHKLLLQNINKFQQALRGIDTSVLPEFALKKKNSLKKSSKIEIKVKNSEHKKSTTKTVLLCPLCKLGDQVQRKNRTSGNIFFGCSRYPDCKWTQSQNTAKSDSIQNKKKSSAKQTIDMIPCPTCQEGYLLERVNRSSGNIFYGCSRYPKCKHTQSTLKLKSA